MDRELAPGELPLVVAYCAGAELERNPAHGASPGALPPTPAVVWILAAPCWARCCPAAATAGTHPAAAATAPVNGANVLPADDTPDKGPDPFPLDGLGGLVAAAPPPLRPPPWLAPAGEDAPPVALTDPALRSPPMIVFDSVWLEERERLERCENVPTSLLK